MTPISGSINGANQVYTPPSRKTEEEEDSQKKKNPGLSLPQDDVSISERSRKMLEESREAKRVEQEEEEEREAKRLEKEEEENRVKESGGNKKTDENMAWTKLEVDKDEENPYAPKIPRVVAQGEGRLPGVYA